MEGLKEVFDIKEYLVFITKIPVVASLITVGSIAYAHGETTSPVVWAATLWRICVLLGSIGADLNRFRQIRIKEALQDKLSDIADLKDKLIWGGDVEVCSFFFTYIFNNVAFFKFASIDTAPLIYRLLQVEVILGNIVWAGSAVVVILVWLLNYYRSIKSSANRHIGQDSDGFKSCQSHCISFQFGCGSGPRFGYSDKLQTQLPLTLPHKPNEDILGASNHLTLADHCQSVATRSFSGVGNILRHLLMQGIFSQHEQHFNIPPDKAICSLCNVSYIKGDQINQFSCRHHFHEKCIAESMHGSSSCPLCKDGDHLAGSDSSIACG
ncbi:hypothetical protein BASA62_002183 [Batrachochytrium salamandrivorans]|nr:hypothetical protein BASA62_002183 [Batrachochytrium salamandrivorans]